MTLIINNTEVAKLLTMKATIDALESSYRALATKDAVCRPRISGLPCGTRPEMKLPA